MKLDKIKFASLIAYVAGIVQRQTIDDTDVKVLDDLIDIEAPVATIQKQDIENLLQAMKENRKIDAIKAYRAMTGASLLESKNLLEAYCPAPVDTRYDRIMNRLNELIDKNENSVTLANFSSDQLHRFKNYLLSFAK